MAPRHSPTTKHRFSDLYHSDVLSKTIRNMSDYYVLQNLKNTDTFLRSAVLKEEPVLKKIAEIITKKSSDVILSMNVSSIEYLKIYSETKNSTVPTTFKQVDTNSDDVSFTFSSPDIHNNRIIIKACVYFDFMFKLIKVTIIKGKSEIYKTEFNYKEKTINKIISYINDLLHIYHHNTPDKNTFIVIKKTPSIDIILSGEKLKKESRVLITRSVKK